MAEDPAQEVQIGLQSGLFMLSLISASIEIPSGISFYYSYVTNDVFLLYSDIVGAIIKTSNESEDHDYEKQ